ncbi:MAG TPA: thioesterase family protein [Actinomycetes bacterium]|jgi:acyl-coenzyme A thioesterase PaaI-like protein|nr:thioesterase family protein [Actinomycetes bacterium]
MAGFDRATALREGGAGRYRAELDPQWSIAGKLNGGYLLSLCGRAAVADLNSGEGAGPPDAEAGAFPHPIAASAHYLASPEAGEAGLDVTVLRRGRRTAVARVALGTSAGICVDALVTCGGLEAGEPFHQGAPPPALPPMADCPRLPVQGPGFEVPLMAVVAEHLDPATMGWAVGRPSRAGELRGWLVLDDGREPDPLFLLTAVDAFPPASFDLGLSGWVPTIALTAYVRALPAPGPLKVRQQARHVAGGRVDEDCDVWDSAGHLVASGYQLAGVRHP